MTQSRLGSFIEACANTAIGFGVALLNPAYAQMARDRISGDAPLFTEVTA